MRSLLQALTQNLLALVDLVEEGHLDVPLLMDMLHMAVRRQTNTQQLAIYFFQFGFISDYYASPSKGSRPFR